MALNAKHQKVTGSSAGKTGTKKKDGYASGRPPEAVIGMKSPGVTLGEGYSGPNVVRISKTEF